MNLHETGIRAVGAWESYPNRVRVGGTYQTEPRFDWECSEEFIRGLAERGYTLYMTQFSKGFGIQTERPWMERTRQVVELCHKHGLAASGYIRYTTIIPETLEAEEPRCLERFAGRTVRGEYARYGRMYWRYIPCPCSEEWLAYMDRVIDIAVNDVRLDMIAFDGITLWPEPEACHCPRCQAAFRTYLAGKYPDRAIRRERFGHEHLEFIEPPVYPTKVSKLRDPVSQEWVLFRCDRMTAIWNFLVDAVKRRRPEVWIDGNIKSEPGLNTAWEHANDIYALHQSRAEAFFTEEPNATDLRPDGAVLSCAATFKKSRHFDKRVLTYNRSGPPVWRELTGEEELARSYAVQLAFGCDSLGAAIIFPVGGFPVRLENWFQLHRERRDLFSGGEVVADVGLYYSTRSLTVNFIEPHLGLLLAQQAMLYHKVPFDYLFGEECGQAARHRAVVLAETECMSEAEAEALAGYVRAGGGLVIVGASGARDDWWRVRPENVLARALGIEWGGNFSLQYVGKGRVAYIPKLDPNASSVSDAGGDKDQASWVEDVAKGGRFGYDCWRPARNAAELVQAARWAAGGFCYEPIAPLSVLAEYVRQPERNRTLIHLVNFDLANDVSGIEIALKNPSGVSGVSAITPDAAGARAEIIGGRVRLDNLHRYVILVLEGGG